MSWPRWLELVASLLVAIGTLILAAVAVFQDLIRSWVSRPQFRITVRTEPPDCVSVPFRNVLTGQFIGDSIYLRIWVETHGNAPARNVEVYARELRRQQADQSWRIVQTFPPMNLKWTNLGPISVSSIAPIYFPSIAPRMGKHCDVGHIADPAMRPQLGEENPALGLNAQEVSLAFDLMVSPNNMTHIIGPGRYQLDILVAAENARPLPQTLEITLPGPWYADADRMLRDGVGIRVL